MKEVIGGGGCVMPDTSLNIIQMPMKVLHLPRQHRASSLGPSPATRGASGPAPPLPAG